MTSKSNVVLYRFFGGIIVSCLSFSAFATDGSDAPIVTPASPYQAELYEINKSQDAERDLAMKKEITTQTQADYENQIAQRKARIEALKAKQEQIATDIKAMQAEVVDYQKKFEAVQKDYSLAEEKHENFLTSLDNEKSNLEEAKQKYENAVTQLTARHENLNKAIKNNLTQVNRLKVEVATLNSTIQSIDSNIASLEADEMKSNAEFAVLKSKAETLKGEKANKLAQLAEADKKLKFSLESQRTAQQELAVAEKALTETSTHVASEVRKIEDATAAAQHAKIVADANKMRVDSEIEKFKKYVGLVKKVYNDALVAQTASETDLTNAQLTLEAAKSELAMNVSNGEQMSYKRATIESQSRTLASVETSNEVLQDNKIWTIKTACQIRERPRSASKSLGEVTPGQRIPASVGPGQWMKTISLGKTAYIRQECGSF